MKEAPRFIAHRLRFKEGIVTACVAVSFLVMIVAVTVSSGFRHEIRQGVGNLSGDVQLTGVGASSLSDQSPISSRPSYYDDLAGLEGVKEVVPAVYRAGIVKNGSLIQGVLFKGIEDPDSAYNDLGVSIPSRLSDVLGLNVGDQFNAYFISERLKARKFTVKDIYPSLLETDQNFMVYASMSDLQRLNGWALDQVSALEVHLGSVWEAPDMVRIKAGEIGTIAMEEMSDTDDTLVATAVVDKYPQLFDWLDLIDFNVLIILLLMTVVAGFNMISGLLILLFRNIPTIGMLKAMGMTNKSIGQIFLRLSSTLVLKGMAIGNGIALLFCLIQGQTHLLKLDPANYFVAFVPVHVNLPMIIIADIAAYLLVMLVLLIPLKFISSVDPAKTLRAQ